MGLLSNFFMSASEKDKLEKTKMRRVTRCVERVIEGLEEKSALLNKECSTLWTRAREQLISGQKSEAAATLRFYKSKNVLGRRVEQQLTLVRHRYDTITGASDMQTMAGALSELARTMGVDVDALEYSMEQVADAAMDSSDVNKSINAIFERDMAKLDRDLAAGEISDDELMKALEEEVAAAGNSNGSIADGQERLRSILNDKK
ncbi:MAG: hypothetical protein IJV93_10710 [Lentisphaeria bacterium]|nr:hypothetical protein [Lentisphaeria bacterium]